jgi:hypothetical protein
MADELLSLAQLSRAGKIRTIVGYSLEVEGKIVGKVLQLLQDKYGRLEGLQIELQKEGSVSKLALPYAKVSGVDEGRKVVLAKF